MAPSSACPLCFVQDKIFTPGPCFFANVNQQDSGHNTNSGDYCRGKMDYCEHYVQTCGRNYCLSRKWTEDSFWKVRENPLSERDWSLESFLKKYENGQINDNYRNL